MDNNVQVRVGLKDMTWQSALLPGVQQAVAYSVTESLDLDGELRVLPGEKVDEIRADTKIAPAIHSSCVALHNVHEETYEVCVESDSGKPISSRDGMRYSSFKDVSSKIFPQDLESPKLSLHIDELKLTDAFSKNAFEPPANAKAMPGCYRAIPPGVIKYVKPEYPGIAQQAKVTGTEDLIVYIDAEGKVVGVKAISGQPMLLPSAEKAATKQAYAPSYCGTRAVPSKLQLQYQFGSTDGNLKP